MLVGALGAVYRESSISGSSARGIPPSRRGGGGMRGPAGIQGWTPGIPGRLASYLCFARVRAAFFALALRSACVRECDAFTADA